MLVGKQFSRSSEAGLNLVEDQQNVVLIGPAAESLDVVDGQRNGSPALESLDEDCADLSWLDPGFGNLCEAGFKECSPVDF